MVGKNSKIYIAGSSGMVGSAIKKRLEDSGFGNLLCRTSGELNLADQGAVAEFFSNEKPEIVVLAAGKVGGILANDTFRADFIYQNLMIQANVIHAAHKYEVEKLVSLGSSCIYPKFAAQPIREESLLTGELEATNEPYAVAKIAGIKLCENYFRQYGANFLSLMPTNLYGERDKFDLSASHVIPALIRKFHEAKISRSPSVVLWGTGAARREFLYAGDLAEAVVFVMENLDAPDLYKQNISQLNIGTGEDIEIKKLAAIIKNIVGFEGAVEYDRAKPDGTPRKLLDVARLNALGWRYSTTLDDGLRKTYRWFLENHSKTKVTG